jgi:hypothetical protein
MKNPMMSLWLSWANQATSAWTAAANSAMKRNQSAMVKAMMTPPSAGKAGAAKSPARKRKSSR